MLPPKGRKRSIMISAARHLVTLSVAKRNRPLVVVLGLMVASLAILPLLPTIPQNPSYHDFADQRTLLAIPTCPKHRGPGRGNITTTYLELSQDSLGSQHSRL